MKKLAIISLLFFVAACEDSQEVTNRQTATFNAEASKYLVYGQDTRTGLCFARLIYYREILAHVPCTPEVLELVRVGNTDE